MDGKRKREENIIFGSDFEFEEPATKQRKLDDNNDKNTNANYVSPNYSPNCSPYAYDPKNLLGWCHEMIDPSTYDETVKQFSEEYKSKSELIIDGYIRQININIFANNQISLFNHIPYAINYLTLKHYHISHNNIIDAMQHILRSQDQTKITPTILETELLPSYFDEPFLPNIYRQMVKKEMQQCQRKCNLVFPNAILKYNNEIIVIKYVNTEKQICSIAKQSNPTSIFANNVPLSCIEYWFPGNDEILGSRYPKVKVIEGKHIYENARLIGIDGEEAVMELDSSTEVVIFPIKSIVMYVE